jgi:hypothetical protein
LSDTNPQQRGWSHQGCADPSWPGVSSHLPETAPGQGLCFKLILQPLLNY